jgi:hypothetical protein
MIRLEHFLAQDRAAAEFMRRYDDYAVSIGCVLGEGAMYGEIQATPEQAKLLHEWNQISHERTSSSLRRQYVA